MSHFMGAVLRVTWNCVKSLEFSLFRSQCKQWCGLLFWWIRACCCTSLVSEKVQRQMSHLKGSSLLCLVFTCVFIDQSADLYSQYSHWCMASPCMDLHVPFELMGDETFTKLHTNTEESSCCGLHFVGSFFLIHHFVSKYSPNTGEMPPIFIPFDGLLSCWSVYGSPGGRVNLSSCW